MNFSPTKKNSRECTNKKNNKKNAFACTTNLVFVSASGRNTGGIINAQRGKQHKVPKRLADHQLHSLSDLLRILCDTTTISEFGVVLLFREKYYQDVQNFGCTEFDIICSVIQYEL